MRRGNNMQSTGVLAGLAAAKAGCVLSAAGRMLAVAALLPAAMADEPCSPGWVDQFCWSGPDASVRAMAVFDAGDGLRLYVGGSFTHAACQRALRVASWDGERWSALPGGVDGTVLAMTVFDDGSGPGLYLGGSFRSIVHADGQTEAVERIVRFDGVQFVPLIDQGSGAAGVNNWVSALAVFDDGGGEALYAGGRMTMAGGRPVQHVARWDGQHWQAVGLDSETGGLNSWVTALAVFDDGSGPGLFAGGTFSLVGGQTPLSGIARWTGAHWEALMSNAGEGLDGTVLALAVHDDGSGPALFAGGAFPTQAQSLAVSNIARWDASGWSALSGPDGTGTSGTVHALASIDDAAGAALAVGGRFTAAGGVGVGNLARWHGDVWSAIGSGPGTDRTVDALAVFDEGAGEVLFAGGAMTMADGLSVSHVVRARGDELSRVEAEGPPIAPRLDGLVWTMQAVDDERGPAVYALRMGAEESLLVRVASGSVEEVDVDQPVFGLPPYSMTWVESGPAAGLWLASRFTLSRFDPFGLIDADPLEKWAASMTIWGLGVHDDGTGPALYLAADVNDAQMPGLRLWRFDGTNLTLVRGPDDSGLIAARTDEAVLMRSIVTSEGRRLVVARGRFEGGAVHGHANAQWDGATWRPMSTDPLFSVMATADIGAMTVVEGGSGPLLVVGGGFSLPPHLASDRMAAWDGQTWQAWPTAVPLGSVLAIETFDDGGGMALYALGTSPPHSEQRLTLARWAEGTWREFGVPDWSELTNLGYNETRGSLAPLVDSHRELLVAGNAQLIGVPFAPVGVVVASYGGCPFVCIGDANGDGAVTPDDLAAFVQSLVAGEASADVNGDGRVDYFDVIRFMAAYEAGCP